MLDERRQPGRERRGHDVETIGGLTLEPGDDRVGVRDPGHYSGWPGGSDFGQRNADDERKRDVLSDAGSFGN